MYLIFMLAVAGEKHRVSRRHRVSVELGLTRDRRLVGACERIVWSSYTMCDNGTDRRQVIFLSRRISTQHTCFLACSHISSAPRIPFGSTHKVAKFFTLFRLYQLHLIWVSLKSRKWLHLHGMMTSFRIGHSCDPLQKAIATIYLHRKNIAIFEEQLKTL